MSDIFISYAEEDRPRAEALAHALEKKGWSVFWDRTIPTGMTWRQVIGRELGDARCVMVLWSEDSIESTWVQEEADEGQRRGILIPVLIEGVLPPIGFRSLQAADLSDWDGVAETPVFRRLVSDIARLLGPPPEETEEQERKRKAEEERKAAEAEEQRKAEEEARQRVAGEAGRRRKAEEDRKQAEAEENRKAEEEARRRAEEAEEKRKAEEEQKQAEAEEKGKAEEERRKAEAEKERKAEAAEAKRRAEAEKKRKAEEAEADRKAEEAAEHGDARARDKRRRWIAIAAGVAILVAAVWGVYRYQVHLTEQAALEEARKAEEMRRSEEEARARAELARTLQDVTLARAEEARRAEEERRAAEEARKAEEARQAEEERRRAEEAAQREAEQAGQRERILEAQHLLAELGYAPGQADGVAGPATERAIARFKRDAGLPGDPAVDEALLVGLRGAMEERASAPAAGNLEPGRTFRDCPECPEMVVVPAGSFTMGSPEDEPGRFVNEGPQHRVAIPRPFAVGKYEVTFEEWDACVAGGGCGGYRPSDNGWGRGRQPVINVSWEDAQAYVAWLRDKTRKPYRLLSEAEWEYACRAGTTTAYSFGDEITARDANYGMGKTSEVGSFPANPWKLHDMHGNVYERVEDAWHESYDGAPDDGSAWIKGGDGDLRVLRGGSWGYVPGFLRSAFRFGYGSSLRNVDSGLRIARTLSP